MEGTVLVDGRGAARSLRALGMKCDNKEIPELSSGAKPAGWWLIAGCHYEGSAATGGESGNPGAPATTELQGTAAVMVGEDRLVGILSPNDKAEPALWWSWPLSSLTVESAGSQGLFKKRPTDITLKAADGTFHIKEVSRLYRHSGNFQSGQEGSFLKALGR